MELRGLILNEWEKKAGPVYYLNVGFLVMPWEKCYEYMCFVMLHVDFWREWRQVKQFWKSLMHVKPLKCWAHMGQH